jgi:hypothetical protein
VCGLVTGAQWDELKALAFAWRRSAVELERSGDHHSVWSATQSGAFYECAADLIEALTTMEPPR